MTIKIDLLPKYVGMRRNLKRFIAFCVALVPILGLFLFVKYYQGQQQLHKVETDVANIQPVAERKKAADAKKDAAVAESGPYKATVDFIVDAGQTGPARAALIDLIRRWIYAGALVSSIDMSKGDTVTMNVALNQPDEYAQFLGILRRASVQNNGVVFSELPLGSGIPGFGAGAAPVAQPVAGQAPGTPPQPASVPTFPLKITAEGKLLNPVVIPAEPIGPGGAGAAGAGAPGGPGPGGRPGM